MSKVTDWMAQRRADELRAADFSMYQRWNGPVVPTLQFASRRKASTVDASMRDNPFVFGPTFRLAMRLGALPIKVFGIDPKTNERKELNTHPGYTLLRKPNPVLTRSLMVSGTVFSMVRHGKFGWWKERNLKGEVTALWPVPGHLLHAVRDPKTLIRNFEVRVAGQRPIPLGFENVCYFRLIPDPDDWADGYSPAQTLPETADFTNAALEGLTDLFTDGFLERLWVDLHGKQLNNVRKEAIAQQVAQARRRARGIPMMEDGSTLENMGTAATGDVMEQAFKAGREVVAEAFGGLAIDWTNEQGRLHYYSENVQPLADAIEQELERSLFSEWPKQPAFPEFAFRETLRGTPGERITSHKDAIYSAQETPNDARRAENMPPLPGGDQLFVPLNLVPVDQAATNGLPRAADSKGGMGGEEGRRTLPRVATASLRAARDTRWETLRTRVLEGQATAFSRQVRGLLNAELKSLRRALGGLGDLERAQGSLDNMQPLDDLLDDLDPAVDGQLIRFLRQFMDQTSDAAWRSALDLLGADPAALDEALAVFFDKRAQAVVSRFGIFRRDQLRALFQSALDNGFTAKQLSVAVNDLYAGQLKTHLADGIGRTEMAFAYEEAAKAAWRHGGVKELDFVFGGGPCTTSICEEVALGGPYRVGEELGDVGASFGGTTTPPLHPSCTCFLVPAL